MTTGAPDAASASPTAKKKASTRARIYRCSTRLANALPRAPQGVVDTHCPFLASTKHTAAHAEDQHAATKGGKTEGAHARAATVTQKH